MIYHCKITQLFFLLQFTPWTSFLSVPKLHSLPHNLVSQSKHCSQHGSCCTGHKTAGGFGTHPARARQARGKSQRWGVCMCPPGVAKADLTKKWDNKQGNKRFPAETSAERVELGKGVYLICRDGCSAQQDPGDPTQLLSVPDPMRLLPGYDFVTVWETFQKQNGIQNPFRHQF